VGKGIERKKIKKAQGQGAGGGGRKEERDWGKGSGYPSLFKKRGGIGLETNKNLGQTKNRHVVGMFKFLRTTEVGKRDAEKSKLGKGGSAGKRLRGTIKGSEG